MEIKHYQKTTHLLLRKGPFVRVVSLILININVVKFGVVYCSVSFSSKKLRFDLHFLLNADNVTSNMHCDGFVQCFN